MIASLEGKIASTDTTSMIIVVGGVGYKVFAPHSAIGMIGDIIFLHTHMVVREDSMTLYGFSTTSDCSLFEILLKISGVGPKVALSILSTLSLDNLRNAIVSDRSEILTRVPGIGKKTAQKILLELKDKIPVGLDAMPSDSGFEDINSDVIDTLVVLGYSIVEAQSAVQALPKDAPDDIEERVRLALQYFI